MHDGIRKRNLIELVEQNYELLYRYAFRLSGSAADAEDLTQQTFLTAQLKLGQLREASRAKAWLCMILRNIYLKGVRDQPSCAEVSLERVPEQTGETRGEGEIDSEELQRVLNELPEEFRSPLILFYFQEFSYKEIAELMEVPIGTVMSRLARGKAYLREQLGGKDSSQAKGRSGEFRKTSAKF